MIHRTTNHYSMMLALAAGLVVAGGPPVKADFFKDVERAFVGTFNDATEGAKGLARDANRAISGAPHSNEPVTYVTGSTSSTMPGQPMSENLVAQVQSELTQAGYNPGSADGINGPRTTRAVLDYQAANGLPADGQVTPALLDHLRSKRTAAYNAGQPSAPAAPSGYAPAPAPAPAGPGNPLQQQSPPPAPATTGQLPPAPVVPPSQQTGLPQLPGAATQQPQQPALQSQTAQQNCKPYERRTRIEGRETVTTGTACLQPDGTWRPIN